MHVWGTDGRTDGPTEDRFVFRGTCIYLDLVAADGLWKHTHLGSKQGQARPAPAWHWDVLAPIRCP